MKAQLESRSWERSLTTILEKIKALDAQRAQLLDDAKKEALENAEKAVAELNELGFHYTLTEGASTFTARSSRKTASQAPSAKRETFPALSAILKRPRITMGECTGHKRPRIRSRSKNSWKRV